MKLAFWFLHSIKYFYGLDLMDYDLLDLMLNYIKDEYSEVPILLDSTEHDLLDLMLIYIKDEYSEVPILIDSTEHDLLEHIG